MNVRISLPRGIRTQIDNMMVDRSTMLQIGSHNESFIQIEIGEALVRIPYAPEVGLIEALADTAARDGQEYIAAWLRDQINAATDDH